MLRIMHILTQPVLFCPYAGEREDNVLSHPPTPTTLYLCLFVKCLLLHTIQKRDSLLVCAGKMGHAVNITGEDKNTHSCHLNIITVA